MQDNVKNGMNDKDVIQNNNNVEDEQAPVFTLTDEETGEELDFILLAHAEIDGNLYYALEPAADNEAEEYVILKVFEDGDDIVLESIEDDEEFEKAEDYFNDLLFSEMDYDA